MLLYKKIPVAVLGATGSVGQKFVELLSNHPWFEIIELCASDKSAGKKYKDAVDWFLKYELRKDVENIVVQKCEPILKSRIVFSGLDSSVAGKVETENSKNHRMDDDVPLLVPEINPAHLELIKFQQFGNGCIVTNPNCSVVGLVLALKPLLDNFGLNTVNVTTMQAISGAGNPKSVKLDIEDNVIPFINGEEEKVEIEPLKIFGKFESGKILYNNFKIGVQCNRVNVTDGHTECVQVNLNQKVKKDEIINAWQEFRGEPQNLSLPSAPKRPIYYFSEPSYPQPKYQRNLEDGMAVSVGRLREDPLFDFKFVILSHNTVRGAAGGAILCAELIFFVQSL